MSEQLLTVLRERFARPLSGMEAHNSMAPSHRHPPGMKLHSVPPRQSAVMLILFGRAETLSTLFIQRPEYDGHHGGQMAFPGGKAERQDRTMLDTAIRECYEEVGILVSPADVVGELSRLHIPVSNLDVYPFVAYLSDLPPQVLDPREVAHTVETTIAQLQLPASLSQKEVIMNGVPVQIPYYNVSGHEVWGATAMITAELLAMLA